MDNIVRQQGLKSQHDCAGVYITYVKKLMPGWNTMLLPDSSDGFISHEIEKASALEPLKLILDFY
jgi:hypothetical protein